MTASASEVYALYEHTYNNSHKGIITKTCPYKPIMLQAQLNMLSHTLRGAHAMTSDVVSARPLVYKYLAIGIFSDTFFLFSEHSC